MISIKTEDYNYELPEELIAQTPLKNRCESKLLVLDKNTGEIYHQSFKDVINYLNEGDALVINDTKVLPARLIGLKKETGAIIEVLLLKNIKDNIWECLTKPQKRLQIGTKISFGDDDLKAEVLDIKDEGITTVKLIFDGILMEVLERLGTMPLPPYIHEKLNDKEYYQTVYAREYGSSAAPTAGLHFTKELLNEISKKGIKIVNITLHVGLGTFRPVNVEDVTKHTMHSEYYILSKKAADILNEVKSNNKKIIAVGTTTVRTLETVINKYNIFKEDHGETNIFIYPGYKFKAVDSLITNFHLPKSTLLMLVSAFTTRDIILKAYHEAIKNKYRFFSFGDAMFIK